MPYLLERMDLVWKGGVGGIDLPRPPSSYIAGRVFGCLFDDQHGLVSRPSVGMDNILFETEPPQRGGRHPERRRRARGGQGCAGPSRRWWAAVAARIVGKIISGWIFAVSP
ncbi:hypothetical protein Ga0074812_115145 [Parafrankia irregularis]|uniref:Uncharacterized protein n=1 Tax=Parafrankia irregularis TaxID=795642 RepID=A0A0S4QQS5_9ACTN|nr:hypothetical protein Ga0074812_115145 [Parafrankia irregularis]